METVQSGILAPPPRLARFVAFSLKGGASPRALVETLPELTDGQRFVSLHPSGERQ